MEKTYAYINTSSSSTLTPNIVINDDPNLIEIDEMQLKSRDVVEGHQLKL